MPQTDFFAVSSDEMLLVRFILKIGFDLVPDVCYEDSKLNYISDLGYYKKVRLYANSYFLWHKESVASPLHMFQVSGSGWNAGKFAIHKRQGGPTLYFVCNSPGEKDGVRTVPAGLVSYYATYRNTVTGEYGKIPPLLRTKYKAIVQQIKQNARRLQFDCLEGGTRSYWMLPGAYQAVRGGAQLGVHRLADLKVKGIEDVPWALGKAQQLGHRGDDNANGLDDQAKPRANE